MYVCTIGRRPYSTLINYYYLVFDNIETADIQEQSAVRPHYSNKWDKVKLGDFSALLGDDILRAILHQGLIRLEQGDIDSSVSHLVDISLRTFVITLLISYI